MKKTSRCTLSLLFLFSLAAPLMGDYYRSNAIGMLLEKLEWYKKDEYRYIIEKQRTGDKEIRRLLDNGEENRRWETSYYPGGGIQEEQEYSKNELINLLQYDKSGRIKEEKKFFENHLEKQTLYYYSNITGFLEYTQTLDAEGKLLYKDTYALTSKGALRQINRLWAEEKFEQSAYIQQGANIYQETHEKNGESLISRFDTEGRIIRWESWLQEKVNLRKSYSYTEGVLRSATEESFFTGKTSQKKYNPQGLLTEEEVSLKEGGKEFYTYKWDNAGNRTEIRKKGAAGLEVWKFSYNSDNSLSYEEYFRKGKQQTKTVYTEEGYYEDLYREGKPFIRVFYEEDVKVKEELLLGR